MADQLPALIEADDSARLRPLILHNRDPAVAARLWTTDLLVRAVRFVSPRCLDLLLARPGFRDNAALLGALRSVVLHYADYEEQRRENVGLLVSILHNAGVDFSGLVECEDGIERPFVQSLFAATTVRFIPAVVRVQLVGLMSRFQLEAPICLVTGVPSLEDLDTLAASVPLRVHDGDFKGRPILQVRLEDFYNPSSAAREKQVALYFCWVHKVRIWTAAYAVATRPELEHFFVGLAALLDTAWNTGFAVLSAWDCALSEARSALRRDPPDEHGRHLRYLRDAIDSAENAVGDRPAPGAHLLGRFIAAQEAGEVPLPPNA